MEIRLDDLSSQQVQDLLAAHLAGMQENSPPDSVYALDLSGLLHADVSVWTAWYEAELRGIGALKPLSSTTGEIKSMRTDSRHLRKGVGVSILDHIITEARLSAAESGNGFRRRI